MNLISIDKLTKNKNDGFLFKEISFGLSTGDKIAVIGTNGCGKSTLLKMIAGKSGTDGGTISINKSASISYLEQIPSYNPEHTIIDHIFLHSSPKLDLIRRYETVCEKIAHGATAKEEKEMSELIEKMDAERCWDYENEIKSILNVLKITDMNKKMGSLSGGTLKKVSLAQTLIEDSNLILLDEPTNHLDVDTIMWLEEYLVKTDKAILMVTHDRYFLDRVTTKIIEMDREKITVFEGNYSYYVEKRDELIANNLRKEGKTESILRTEMEWLRRGPKARGTKSKARKDRIYSMINRDVFKEDESFSLSTTGRRLGNKILDVKNITKCYGTHKVISDFTYSFKKGERLGIAGVNGAGKTTLINLLTGSLTPDSGSVDRGVNTVIAHFRQDARADFKENETVIEYIKSQGDLFKLADGSELTPGKLLERFLFNPAIQYSPVSKLSGGELKRLILVRLLLSNPNFLILDEPTNDFDIRTLNILEDFLVNYEGCLITVSHDRFFMDKVVDELLVLEGDSLVRKFGGTFSDYLDYRDEQEENKESVVKQVKTPPQSDKKSEDKKTKLSFKEKKELEETTAGIEKLEADKQRIETELSSGAVDYSRINLLQGEYDKTCETLEKLYARWEELASRE